MAARIEWPTLAVATAIYGGFALTTWWHHALPWPLLLVLGGYLVAWHGSLQHEVVHGHPTGWPWLNELLVLPSLWLWLPFRLYRESHLTHHDDPQLTDPRRDPESFYLAREDWQRLGPLTRRARVLYNTAVGRLLLGPLVVTWQTLSNAASDITRGRVPIAAWAMHLLGASLVLGWVLGVCDIPLSEYLLLYAVPGTSLTLLRSFAEHEARPHADERTVAVEANPLLALLYLNNNLHPAHHAHPHLAWYRLPRAWARQRSHSRVLDGYVRLLVRHALSPRITPVWPFEPKPAAKPQRSAGDD